MLRILLSALFVYAGLVPDTFSPSEKSEFFKTLNNFNFTVNNFENKGLGLVHQNEQKAGANILCVPEDLHIKHTETFPFSPYISHLSSLEQLACRVLYEKFQSKKDKFVRRYIGTIPSDLPSPLTWSNSTWSLLEKWSLFPNISRNLDTKVIHKNIQDSLKNLLNLDKNVLRTESIEWAFRVAQTRSMKFVGENGEEVLIIVPFLDMANYWPRPLGFELPSLYAQEDMICIRSPFDRNPGDEVLIDYGTYETSYFFSRYLFNIPNNPYDYISLRLNTNKGPEKWFKLYAYTINEDLFEWFLMEADPDLKFFKPFRNFTQENLNARSAVLSALKKYRTTFIENSNIDLPGIRECRRYTPLNTDEQLVKNFALSSRTTLYNHLKWLDKETLFALHLELLSNY